MTYLDAFDANTPLIEKLGTGNAHLVWALAMYLEEPDPEALASQALTDGADDKKIDFIYLDLDGGRIIFAQGYYAQKAKEAAPTNKASDLNTAAAWLISGKLEDIPSQLRPSIQSCRDVLQNGEVESVELLYVHNLPESVNVAKELQTVSAHLRTSLGDESGVTVSSKELGQSQIEHLFSSHESHIEVKNTIKCPETVAFKEIGPKWEASILTVPALWLHELFSEYGEALFSANYRGFLGITKRRRINTGIRASAETTPEDFWVFNNGITLLTYKTTLTKSGTELNGISIINGAQTTGSIGSVDISRHNLANVRVLCRIIQCTDPGTIGDIVKYNNTQNEITTWDQYSNNADQNRITREFSELGYSYSRKRGFREKGDQIGIEEVAQALVAFHGRYQDANRGKNRIFERTPLYNNAFAGKKARHILFVYTLAKSIDERRIELKTKSTNGTIISVEESQLRLLRNLRFKYFFVTVVGTVLEAVLSTRVDTETVAFSSPAAKSTNNSLIELVAAWSPIVETILTFLTTQVDANDIGEQMADEDAFNRISKAVAALVYTNRGDPAFKTFSSLVSQS